VTGITWGVARLDEGTPPSGGFAVGSFFNGGPNGGGYPNVATWDPNNPGVVLIGTDIGGISKSTDYGKTFLPSRRGLGWEDSQAKVSCLKAHDLGSGQSIYTAGTGFKGVGGEVMSSTDYAVNWTVDSADISFSGQNSNAPLPTGRPRSTDPNLILRLASGRWVAGTYDADFWRSVDDRANWTNLNLFTGTVHVRTMCQDPQDANAVYVGLWGDDASIPNKGLHHVTNLNGTASISKISGMPDVVESLVTCGTRIYAACGTFGVRRLETSGASGSYTYDGGTGTAGPVNESHQTLLDGFRDLTLEIDIERPNWTTTGDLIAQWDTGSTAEQVIRLGVESATQLRWRMRDSAGSLFSKLITWTPPANNTQHLFRIENRSDGTGELFIDSVSASTWSHNIDLAGLASQTTTTGLTLGQSGDTVYAASIETDVGGGGGGTVITNITGTIGTSTTCVAVDAVEGSGASTDMVLIGTANAVGGRVYRSSNGGGTWTNTTASGVSNVVWNSTEVPLALADHGNWALNGTACDVSCVAISPHDPDAWIATSTSIVWCTVNAGVTWRPAAGYQISTYRVCEVAPSTGHLAAGSVDHDVIITSDDGGTWDSIGVGGVTVTHALAFSPDGTEIAYADNERDNNTSGAECYVSSNIPGAASGTNTGWNATTPGAAGKRIIGLTWVILANGTTDRLIAAVDNGGIYTIDRATTTWGSWTNRVPSGTAFGSQDNSGLRASVISNGTDMVFAFDREKGIWRSNNYGANWTRVTNVASTEGYLAYDDANDRLYLTDNSAVRRINSASAATSPTTGTDLGLRANEGPIAFGADGRLFAYSRPVNAGTPDCRFSYTDNPESATPTWVDITPDVMLRMGPQVHDLSVGQGSAGKIVMCTGGEGLIIGSYSNA